MAAAYAMAWSPSGDIPAQMRLPYGERAVQVTVLDGPWPEPADPTVDESAVPNAQEAAPAEARGAETRTPEPGTETVAREQTTEPARPLMVNTEAESRPLVDRFLTNAARKETTGAARKEVSETGSASNATEPVEEDSPAVEPEAPRTAVDSATNTTASPPTPTAEPVDQPRAETAPAEDNRRKGVRTGVRAIDVPTPRYPVASRRRGEEGVVIVEVEVLADGTVGHVQAVEDPGYPLLTEAALEAARRATFRPAVHAGTPVRNVVRIPFRFVLE